MDSAEGFDVQILNAVALPGLGKEAAEHSDLLGPTVQRVGDLMIRVKRELDDPLTAGAFLRDQTLVWYHQSPAQSDWAHRMPDAWGGIFAESRVIGGRLHPWVGERLRRLREACLNASTWRTRAHESRARLRAVEAATSRTPHQTIQAEVAQAILDDLATHPRTGATTPLVHLSELAVRREVATVNGALAVLFSSSELGPFVILHPNRYPDCDEVFIRPPAGNAAGAALAYALVQRASARRSAPKEKAPGEAEAAGVGPEVAPELDEDLSVWDEPSVSPETWVKLLDQWKLARRRLASPPKDFRGRPSYLSLQELVLADKSARAAFLAVRWRGRPSGLPLLAALLHEGSLAPEVSTDHEYLDAELGELAGIDPRKRESVSDWKLPGWKISRQGQLPQALRYTAVPDPEAGASG
jgi:hypothetical protein